MKNHVAKWGLFALFLGSLAHAADNADAVFARIDNAAKTFKGVSANVSVTEHSGLINSDDVKTGTVKVLRVKPGEARYYMEWTDKSQVLSYDGREAKQYTPKTNTVDVFNVAEKRSAVDQYLLLGFGATTADLNASYDVTYAGEENAGGQPASHLKLIPKSADAKRGLKQADLWYGSNGLVVQQKILKPSGDYNQYTYTNMKFGPMPEKDLEIKLPKGVTVQKH